MLACIKWRCWRIFAFFVDVSCIMQRAGADTAVSCEALLRADLLGGCEDAKAEAFLDGTVKTRSDGVFDADLRVRATIPVLCAKCLAECVINCDEKFSLCLVNTNKNTPSADDKADEADKAAFDEAVFFDGTTADLTEAVIGVIKASMPISVRCGETCKGLCPMCGKNKNEIADCGCVPEPFNSVSSSILNELKFQ